MPRQYQTAILSNFLPVIRSQLRQVSNQHAALLDSVCAAIDLAFVFSITVMQNIIHVNICNVPRGHGSVNLIYDIYL